MPGAPGVPGAPGNAAWSFPGGEFGIKGLRCSDGVVLIGAALGVVGLDPATGRQRWVTTVSATMSGIDHYAGITDGTLYLVGGEPKDTMRRVYAIDVASGKTQWTFETPEGTYATGAYGVLGGALYLVVGHAGGTRQEVWAVDTVNRSVRWKVPSPSNSDVIHVPGSGRLIYTRSRADGGNITALDIADGAVVWSRTDVSWASTSVMESGLTGGALLASNRRDTVSGLDPETGATRWSMTGLPLAPSTDFQVYCGPDTYYVCDGTTLFALRPGGDHTPTWQADVSHGDAFNAGGFADGGTFYFLAENTLRAFDATTGASRWTHPTVTSAGYDVKFAAAAGHCYVETGELFHGEITALTA